jgi:predicted GIY-YIG superfamily endonuclease
MYVYILKSQNHKDKFYVGFTTNPHRRICQHNEGRNKSTARHAPWEFASITWLPDKRKALSLEKYFKSGSGRAFWRKR